MNETISNESVLTDSVDTDDLSSAASGATVPRQLSAQALADALRVTLRLGVAMLRNGTSSYRADLAMTRMAKALGVERVENYITPTGIISSVYSGREHRTQVERVPNLSVDLNRVTELELLSRHLSADVTPQALNAALDRIDGLRPGFSRVVVILMVGVACGALAAILNGGPIEFIAAFCGATAAQIVRFKMIDARFRPIPISVVCAAIATLISYGIIRLAQPVFLPLLVQWGFHLPSPRAGVVASVLLLVPGVSLVTSVLDIVRFDLVSGVARGIYAFTLIICIALGMLMVLSLTGFEILEATLAAAPVDVPILVQYAAQASFGFLATVGFGILFNVPRYTIWRCGLVGALGHLLRFWLRQNGLSNEVATFSGALFVGVFGYWQARAYHLPRLVFTVVGIVSMIPGIPAFETLIFFSRGEIISGVTSLVRASLLTGAIAAGLGSARIFTEFEMSHNE